MGLNGIGHQTMRRLTVDRGWQWPPDKDGFNFRARPEIVTLCGSRRFQWEYDEWYRLLTLGGAIVLSIARDELTDPRFDDAFVKAMLDDLHFEKIKISDRVMVLNVGGYIGESTKGEIEFAQARQIPITYLEDPQ